MSLSYSIQHLLCHVLVMMVVWTAYDQMVVDGFMSPRGCKLHPPAASSTLCITSTPHHTPILRSSHTMTLSMHASKSWSSVALLAMGISSHLALCLQPTVAVAASSKYDCTLDQCFNIVQRELTVRKSLNRIDTDIHTENWQDLRVFTKEYDGFRGSVLKAASKQLQGKNKEQATDLTNKVMYDLIGINKAARHTDKEAAITSFQSLEEDLKTFLTLQPPSSSSP